MTDSATSWHAQLRNERGRVGLSRPSLAELVGVPVDTLRRWEDGSRRPPERRLRQLLDVLKVTGGAANAILAGAGYRVDPTLFPNWQYPNYFFDAAELEKVVENVPWPEFVLDNNIEVVAANAAVQAVWGIDFAAERAKRTRAQMSLLSVASDLRFADRLLNWDECLGVISGVFKGQPRSPESLDEPSPYFDAVLAEFADGDPVFLQRFLRVFSAAKPERPKCRGTYPVVWKDEEFGVMRFLALRTTASEPDGLGFNDWMPIDGETWGVLDRVTARTAGR
jgi:transcriptional regulator with XRE-family HTH domain